MVAYLKLFRFPLVFTAVADSAAGYLIVSGGAPDPVLLALLAVASSGLYMFGMGSNDLADAVRDRAIHPERVLPSGALTTRQGWTAAVAVLAVSGIAVAGMPAAGPWRFAAWGGAVVLILAYNFWIKIPPVMGLIRSANYLLGFLVLPAEAVLGADPGETRLSVYRAFLVWPAVSLAIYGTGLTFASLLEEGRKHGKLVFGAAAMMIVGAFLLAYPPLALRPHWGWAASGPLVAWITFRALRAKSRRGVMLMVRDGVAGFILVDASFVLMAGFPVQGAAIAALLVPAFACLSIFKRMT